MKKICYILRGIPGSGKSFLAQQLLKEHEVPYDGHVFSTDNFWIPETRKLLNEGKDVSEECELNEYKKNFDIQKLGHAHLTNFRLFCDALRVGTSPVIVDNTNTTRKEMKDYVLSARGAGYEIEIREPQSKWWLEYAPYLKNKAKEPAKLRRFAEVLLHRNKHGVPLDVITRMIDRYDADVSVDKFG